MLETINTSAITAFITALVTFIIQERKLKVEMIKVRTEFMAEQAAKQLLESEQWQRRSFERIQKRLGGFEENELRKILVRAGAVRFEGDDGKEYWGLISRNRDVI